MSLVSVGAHAQSSLELVWNAPSECPQEAAVRERLQALVGKPTGARRHLSATGRIERVGKRYRLVLSVREGADVRERTVNADSCNDLAGAAAVALGLLIRNERGAVDSNETVSGTKGATGRADERGNGGEAAGATHANAADREPPTKAATVAVAPSNKASEKNQKAEHEDEKASPGNTTSDAGASNVRRWRILLRAPVGILSLGRLPKPSGGIGAALGASYDAWRVMVAARVFASQTLESSNPYEAGARVGRRDLSLGVCRDWRNGRLAFAPCLSGVLQRETAQGSGLGVTPQPASAISFVITAAAEARLLISEWVSLAGSAAMGVETSRPTLEVSTAGEVKKLGPVDLSFSLGPEWIF
jgi:hypothetical protein